MELVILLALAIYAISYRLNPDADVEGTFKFIKHGIGNIYEKYAPYSYKQIRNHGYSSNCINSCPNQIIEIQISNSTGNSSK